MNLWSLVRVGFAIALTLALQSSTGYASKLPPQEGDLKSHKSLTRETYGRVLMRELRKAYGDRVGKTL